MNLLLTASASSGAPTISDIVDSGLISTLKDIYVELTGLFTVFPVNIFLTLTIAGMAIALISKVVSSFRAAN